MKFLNKQQHYQFVNDIDKHIDEFRSNFESNFKLFQSNSNCKHMLTEELSSNNFPIIITECKKNDGSFNNICKSIIKLTFDEFEDDKIVSEEDNEITSSNIHIQVIAFRINKEFKIIKSQRQQLTKFNVFFKK